MKLTLLVLVLIASIPAVAVAEAKDTSISVDVDLTESAPRQDDQVLTFTLALARDHDCASAETSQGATDYQVKVCREGGDILSFEVQRTEHTKDGGTLRKVRASSKLAAGKRTVIAKIARGATDATEIAAEVK